MRTARSTRRPSVNVKPEAPSRKRNADPAGAGWVELVLTAVVNEARHGSSDLQGELRRRSQLDFGFRSAAFELILTGELLATAVVEGLQGEAARRAGQGLEESQRLLGLVSARAGVGQQRECRAGRRLRSTPGMACTMAFTGLCHAQHGGGEDIETSALAQ